ncbi:MAG: replication and repair protein RecN, partial [Bacteroidetes bacterium]|nr:replication and repair protein RecN [Bacteroidota bacterium]
VIKEGTQKSVVEANFEIGNYHLQSFFDENELDYSDICQIRREITVAGKSRAFINDTPVSLNLLRDLSNRLLDIHSQHENLLLSTEDYQLQVVDTIAQLEEAHLKTGEQTDLEEELETLSHVEEIKRELQMADTLLSMDEANVLKSMKEISNAVQRIKNYLPKADNWSERIESIYIDLKDLSLDISAEQERTDFNPERLEYVDNRLSLLYALQKKFKAESVEELITLRDSYRKQLNRIDNFEDELKETEKLVNAAYNEMKNTARMLTVSREKAKPTIEKYLIEQLSLLGMANVQFVVGITNSEDYTEKGNNTVEFLFSANKNRSVQAVAEIASGGEISRLMLAIKSLLIRQIAAKGNAHFCVYKDHSGIQTETYIKYLTDEERVKELAQMLSGKTVTDAALMNARELLKN